MDFVLVFLGQSTGATPPEDIMNWLSAVKDLGLAVGLVLFFVFKGDKRETKYEDRIASLEQFQKETLLLLVKENSGMMSELSTLIQQNSEIVGRCVRLLENHDYHSTD